MQITKSRRHCAALSTLSLLFLSAAAVAGPGKPQTVGPENTVHPGEKARIAFVTNNSSDWWTLAKSGVLRAKTELSDADINFVMPSDGTAAAQQELVEQEISQGVTGIAIAPVDPSNQSAWIDELVGRGITVVTQDSDAPASKRLCFVGMDNHAAGMLAGREIRKALPRGGKIAIFVGIPNALNARERISGIRDALKGSHVTIVDVKADQADHALAFSNAADALRRHPDLAGEIGVWSYNGPTILAAVHSARKIGKVKIVCFDEEDQVLEGIESRAISATIVAQPELFGYRSIKLLDAAVHGDQSRIPASGKQYVSSLAITASNIRAFKAHLAAMRSGR
jgi:ribose transport system substrate-binding protein